MAAHLTDSWLNCYSKGWGRNRLRPASFAHPAKVSYGLSVRIYEHAIEEGWIEPGGIVLDPFAGIGGFALEAMRHGLNFVGCELEQRFVDMGQGCDCTGISKADWVRFQGRWDRARYQDGRHWCPECIMKAGIVADEREFKALPLPGTEWATVVETRQATLFDAAPSTSYVRNSGQIPCTRLHHYRGNVETWEAQGMPGTAVIVQGDSRQLGEVLARAQICVSSPPWGATRDVGTTDWMAKEKAAGRLPSGTGGDATRHNNANMLKPKHPANLGNLPDTGFELALSSPVYHSNTGSDDPDKRGGLYRDPKRRGDKTLTATYSEDEAQLAQMPRGDLSLAISSPPFGIAETRNRTPFQGGDVGDMMSRAYTQDRQGIADGQLAALPEGSHAEACKRPAITISSPPYIGTPVSAQGADGKSQEWNKAYREYQQTGDHAKFQAQMTEKCDKAGYGGEQGQLAQMPPGDHAAALAMSNTVSFKIRQIANHYSGAQAACKAWLSGSLVGNPIVFSPSNIHVYGIWIRNWSRCFVQFMDKRIVIVKPNAAALETGAETGRVQACISSPPYGIDTVHDGGGKVATEKHVNLDGYGATPGNLGHIEQVTFWAASRQILEEVYQVLAPGGHAIWVVKMFVRNKKLVDFPGQWEALCQSVGFRTVCKHRAWMNKNAGIVQIDFDGDEVSMELWYKSFFRLICERKGSPRVDFETVLCMVKPS